MHLFQTKQSITNPKILNVLVQLETQGKSDYTKRNVENFLSLMSKNADLDNPSEVLLFISRHQCSNSMKEGLSYAYRKYCKYYNINAEIPFYEHNSKPVHVPTKEKLQIFISNASKTLCTKLTLSMEAGLRPIELYTLKVKDVDIEQRLVYPTTAKHGASRGISQDMTVYLKLKLGVACAPPRTFQTTTVKRLGKLDAGAIF